MMSLEWHLAECDLHCWHCWQLGIQDPTIMEGDMYLAAQVDQNTIKMTCWDCFQREEWEGLE